MAVTPVPPYPRPRGYTGRDARVLSAAAWQAARDSLLLILLFGSLVSSGPAPRHKPDQSATPANSERSPQELLSVAQHMYDVGRYSECLEFLHEARAELLPMPRDDRRSELITRALKLEANTLAAQGDYDALRTFSANLSLRHAQGDIASREYNAATLEVANALYRQRHFLGAKTHYGSLLTSRGMTQGDLAFVKRRLGDIGRQYTGNVTGRVVPPGAGSPTRADIIIHNGFFAEALTTAADGTFQTPIYGLSADSYFYLVITATGCLARVYGLRFAGTSSIALGNIALALPLVSSHGSTGEAVVLCFSPWQGGATQPVFGIHDLISGLRVTLRHGATMTALAEGGAGVYRGLSAPGAFDIYVDNQRRAAIEVFANHSTVTAIPKAPISVD